MIIRRKTRESRRHERAAVLQQIGDTANDPHDWQRQRKIEVARIKRAKKKSS